MDHPKSWLRYLPASELDEKDSDFDFDDTDVESPTGEHLGNVDGFVVDRDSGRPYYVVVDSGGWFKSKHFLVPVGHAHLDMGREVLVADLTKERVEQFPGFDTDMFETITPEELGRFNDTMCDVCATGTSADNFGTQAAAAMSDRAAFRQPVWWRASRTPSVPAGGSTAHASGK
jgi:PRC-barrel domain protein